VSVVDDDATELSKTSPATASGDWHFVHSTDGGALSGFPLPGDWSVTVAPSFLQGITAFSWVDSEEMHHPLILDQPVTITAESKAAACRANCTVPRCGDGIVDAGEVCDDGNTQGGDGCAADCKSLD
jgi:cysteine-rich repeat protein